MCAQSSRNTASIPARTPPLRLPRPAPGDRTRTGRTAILAKPDIVVIEEYEGGDSIRTLAERYGCSFGKIRNLLRLYSIPLRARGGTPGTK